MSRVNRTIPELVCVLRQNPQDAAALFELGYAVYSQQRDYELCIELCEHAIEAGCRDSRVFVTLARALVGESEKTGTLLLRIEEIERNYAMAKSLSGEDFVWEMAQAYARAGLHEMAIQRLESLLATRPTFRSARILLIQSHLDIGNFAQGRRLSLTLLRDRRPRTNYERRTGLLLLSQAHTGLGNLQVADTYRARAEKIVRPRTRTELREVDEWYKFPAG